MSTTFVVLKLLALAIGSAGAWIQIERHRRGAGGLHWYEQIVRFTSRTVQLREGPAASRAPAEQAQRDAADQLVMLLGLLRGVRRRRDQEAHVGRWWLLRPYWGWGLVFLGAVLNTTVDVATLLA